MSDTMPRDHHGHFVTRQCPDPNCDGTLQPQGDGLWTCDGLTHTTDTGPLVACEHRHQDGEPDQAIQDAAWADSQKLWDPLRREFAGRATL